MLLPNIEVRYADYKCVQDDAEEVEGVSSSDLSEIEGVGSVRFPGACEGIIVVIFLRGIRRSNVFQAYRRRDVTRWSRAEASRATSGSRMPGHGIRFRYAGLQDDAQGDRSPGHPDRHTKKEDFCCLCRVSTPLCALSVQNCTFATKSKCMLILLPDHSLPE